MNALAMKRAFGGKTLVGDLVRHRVAIQANTPTVGDSGKQTASWSTSATVNGTFRPVSAREVIRAEKPIGEITHVWTLRYRSDVTILPKHRLLWNSRAFYVAAPPVLVDGRAEMIEVLTKEGPVE